MLNLTFTPHSNYSLHKLSTRLPSRVKHFKLFHLVPPMPAYIYIYTMLATRDICYRVTNSENTKVAGE